MQKIFVLFLDRPPESRKVPWDVADTHYLLFQRITYEDKFQLSSIY